MKAKTNVVFSFLIASFLVLGQAKANDACEMIFVSVESTKQWFAKNDILDLEEAPTFQQLDRQGKLHRDGQILRPSLVLFVTKKSLVVEGILVGSEPGGFMRSERLRVIADKGSTLLFKASEIRQFIQSAPLSDSAISTLVQQLFPERKRLQQKVHDSGAYKSYQAPD